MTIRRLTYDHKEGVSSFKEKRPAKFFVACPPALDTTPRPAPKYETNICWSDNWERSMNTIMRMICVVIALLSGTAGGQTDRLIGTWSGSIDNWTSNGPAERVMAIRSVQPNGAAVGEW